MDIEYKLNCKLGLSNSLYINIGSLQNKLDYILYDIIDLYT